MHRLKITIKWILNLFIGKLFFRPFYAIRTSGPVWFYVLNKEGRELWAKDKSRSGKAEQRIIKELRTQGISFSHLDELFPGKNLLSRLNVYAEGLEPQAKMNEEKPYLKSLWTGTQPDLGNPFFILALDPVVLTIINGYTEMFSRFDYFSLETTLPIFPGSSPFRSQGWHRDPEDKRMCKVFIYLNDVDESAGPFIYITGSHYGGRLGGVFPQNPPKGSYPPSQEIDKIIPKEAIQICTGRAGTIIFADTAGLHRGGYATAKERLMFTSAYTSKAALRPAQYKLPQDQVLARTVRNMGGSSYYALFCKEGSFLRFLNKLSDFSRKYDFY